jgi:hypothetical protein
MNKYSHMSRTNINYKPENDYYTPSWVFEKLSIKFDLDVCAPIGGVDWIPAENHYHLEMDGLKQNWFGKVWMNPPYSKPSDWVDKFIDHGNGVCLVPFSKSKWFGKLWNQADAIIAMEHSFKFEHKDYGTKSVFMPVFLASIGNDCTSNLKISGIGRVR